MRQRPQSHAAHRPRATALVHQRRPALQGEAYRCWRVVPVAVWSIESNRHNRTELHEYMEAKGYSCTDPDHINTVCHLTKEDSE